MAARLTAYLIMRKFLRITNIDEVKHRLATCESTREVLDDVRRDDDSGASANISETLEVGVDADNDFDLRIVSA